MRELRVIRGEAAAAPAAITPVRLDARTRRPGIAHEQIEVALAPAARTALERVTSADRLPPGLAAVIGIESQRAVEVATHGRDERRIVQGLDWAARRPVLHSPGTQLGAYALALRRPEPVALALPDGPLNLFVPYHTLLAWEIAAAATELRLSAWCCTQLIATTAGRRLWEAAAAERGQLVAEWVAFQLLADAGNRAAAPECRPSPSLSSPGVGQTTAEIVERLFARAREDPVSSPLAEAFEAAYQESGFTADGLGARVRALVAERSRRAGVEQ